MVSFINISMVLSLLNVKDVFFGLSTTLLTHIAVFSLPEKRQVWDWECHPCCVYLMLKINLINFTKELYLPAVFYLLAIAEGTSQISSSALECWFFDIMTNFFIRR